MLGAPASALHRIPSCLSIISTNTAVYVCVVQGVCVCVCGVGCMCVWCRVYVCIVEGGLEELFCFQEGYSASQVEEKWLKDPSVLEHVPWCCRNQLCSGQ